MKEIKFEKEFNYREQTFFLTFIFFGLIVTGISCNAWVMIANEGKMPVLDMTGYFEGYILGSHSFYTNKSEVNYPFLTDRLEIKNIPASFSVGDIFLYSSFVLLIYLTVRYSRLIKAYYKQYG